VLPESSARNVIWFVKFAVCVTVNPSAQLEKCDLAGAVVTLKPPAPITPPTLDQSHVIRGVVPVVYMRPMAPIAVNLVVTGRTLNADSQTTKTEEHQ
jgi:hypothetical protein